jgi:hypothetical protein
MTEPRDDIPFEDFDEQQRDLDTVSTPAEGEELPDHDLDPRSVDANEADALEQSLPVAEGEDYPPGPTEE